MRWIPRSEEAALRARLDAGARVVTVHGLGGSGASALVARALDDRGPVLRVDLSASRARAPTDAPPGTWVFFDQVHDARAARAVAAFVARSAARVVVAARRPLGLAEEHRVPLHRLRPEDTRALIDEALRRQGRKEESAALDPLVAAADGWPAAALALVRMTRVLGASAAAHRFAEVLDAEDEGRCAAVLLGVWQGLPASARVAWTTLSCAHAALGAADLDAVLGAGLRGALHPLLDSGVLEVADGLVRVPSAVATFARRHAPEAMRQANRRAHAAAVLREGEAARARHRVAPVETGSTLERLRGDLLALACDPDASTAMRAALVLEPLFVGRLERAAVVGLYERALRLAAGVSEAAVADVTLALARTWITRGEHESAERLLETADVLDGRPRTHAYRRIYQAHLHAWRGHHARATALLDTVDAQLDDDVAEDTRLQRIFVALQRGELDEADTLARIAAESAARRPSPRMLAAARRFTAEIFLLRGDAAGAVPLLSESRDALARCGDHAGALFFTSRLVEALRLTGRAHDAEVEARRASEQAARAGESTLELTVLQALGGDTASWTRVAELAWRSQMPTLRAQARRWLAESVPEREVPTLRLTTATRSAATDGAPLSLVRRPTLWRLLLALAEAHARNVALPQDVLFTAGWPDERAEPDSRKKRVQTAVWTLRRQLLGEHLQTRPAGYALAVDLRVSIERG